MAHPDLRGQGVPCFYPLLISDLRRDLELSVTVALLGKGEAPPPLTNKLPATGALGDAPQMTKVSQPTKFGAPRPAIREKRIIIPSGNRDPGDATSRAHIAEHVSIRLLGGPVASCEEGVRPLSALTIANLDFATEQKDLQGTASPWPTPTTLGPRVYTLLK